MDPMRITVRNSMKKYQLGLYEKAMPSSWSWVEKLSAAKESGFDFLEISIDETDEKLNRLNNQAELDNIKHAIEVTGFPIRTMCLSGHRKFPLGSNNEQIVVRSLEIMEHAIDLADQLGIRIIQLAGYDVYYEDGSDVTRDRFERNLRLAVEMASKKSIVLGFETMETAFMDTVTKAMNYVEIIDSPYLQVYPDMGNLTNASKLYGHDVLEDILRGKGHIAAAHIKETIAGHYREIPFGTGHVDFNRCISTFWNLGVRMFTAEFWYDKNTDAMEVLKYNQQFVSRRIEESA
jgi:L-ribulose-5-phosphate 3-epimerase